MDTAPQQPEIDQVVTSSPPGGTGDAAIDPLAAIVRGETPPSSVHDSVASEPAVLEIDRFNFWYGASQALYDISMNVQRKRIDRAQPRSYPLVGQALLAEGGPERQGWRASFRLCV